MYHMTVDRVDSCWREYTVGSGSAG